MGLKRALPLPPGTVIPWGSYPSWRKLPQGARRPCKRCIVVSFKATHGRQFCGGCTKNRCTNIRWRKAGRRETY